MCDPLTAVAAVGSLASAGAGIYEGMQAQAGIEATRQAQENANNQWVAYQQRIHQQQADAEDAARSKATAAQQATLSKVTPAAQEATQTTEQQRLNSLYNKPGAGAAAGSGTAGGASPLSGESSGNQTFMSDLTKQVTQATAQARQRIAALATANSYGGSFGGLGTTVPIAFAQGGNDINLQNAIRQGNLKTYGVEQQVQPVNYQVGPGTYAQQSLGEGLMKVAGALAGGVGPKLLSGASGALASGFGSGGELTGSAVGSEAAGGLTPQFTTAALNSFNNPIWNQWG